jgi:pimeloyl-ACP methyl ester carboxylesterase
MLTRISTAWNISSERTLYFVQNARGGDTTHYLQDVLFPYRNVSGTAVNYITNSSVYTTNLRNFWNRNISDPRIILNSDALPGSNQSPSNESAIYKQGFALKIMIDSVLRVTGASKVILLGHSMGGLAIREYLQRRENGINKWWLNPNDFTDGHKVAKVVTIGTPHLGTDVGSIPFSGIDFNSEAIRDMRNSYTSAGNNGAYLFGNVESAVPGTYYNKDINCNGLFTDTITGISSGTADNPAAPLPLNIQYTWILSNYLGLGTDLAVPVSSQALYDSAFVPHNLADTIMTNRNHIQETSDTRTLLRGLDEPDSRDFAYDVLPDRFYSGFITLQSNGITSDTDYYKLNLTRPGTLSVKLYSLNSGVSKLALISDSGFILQSKDITVSVDSIFNKISSGNCFIRISGSSNLNPNINNYRFIAAFLPALELNITLGIEGMQGDSNHVQDTIRVYLRNSVSPYSVADSAIAYLNSSGNAIVNFLDATAGDYYLQTDHRNAMETWSSMPVNFTNGITVVYDFTSSQSQAHGNNLMLRSGKWCLYSGDIDSDGSIDLSDIISTYNDASDFVSGYVVTDLTGDNIVSLDDMIITYNNSISFVTVKRP